VRWQPVLHPGFSPVHSSGTPHSAFRTPHSRGLLPFRRLRRSRSAATAAAPPPSPPHPHRAPCPPQRPRQRPKASASVEQSETTHSRPRQTRKPAHPRPSTIIPNKMPSCPLRAGERAALRAPGEVRPPRSPSPPRGERLLRAGEKVAAGRMRCLGEVASVSHFSFLLSQFQLFPFAPPPAVSPKSSKNALYTGPGSPQGCGP